MKLIVSLSSLAMSYIVFLILDLLDCVFCVVFRVLDRFFEGSNNGFFHCYCNNKSKEDEVAATDGDFGNNAVLSETLHARKNVFREIGFHQGSGKPWKIRHERKRESSLMEKNRWSDCGCQSCVSWMNSVSDQRLHLVVKHPVHKFLEEDQSKPVENVIFLHGFLSSSSFWKETVFPNLSESSKDKYKLFAIDLLGFGKSPKPSDCLYTLKDHLEMIEKSVINPFQLKSFHLVAHSMGCILATALAAKYSNSVKTITLIAPPYFPASSNNKEDASVAALKSLAGKRLWPPLSFGSALMSWYEHLGRFVCFIICRNHRTWEHIFNLITKRDVHFMLVDLTRHTHHSAWHTMHNVICGGAKLMENFLETLRGCGIRMYVYQGAWDQVVPLECSNNLKIKVPEAHVIIVPDADHVTIVLGREKDFTRDLEFIWNFSSKGELLSNIN